MIVIAVSLEYKHNSVTVSVNDVVPVWTVWAYTVPVMVIVYVLISELELVYHATVIDDELKLINEVPLEGETAIV